MGAYPVRVVRVAVAPDSDCTRVGGFLVARLRRECNRDYRKYRAKDYALNSLADHTSLGSQQVWRNPC